MVALYGYVPKINLSSAAALGDLVKTHTVAGQGVPHAAPMTGGDFAMVLGTGTSPAALLFATPLQSISTQQYYAPTGLTGATQASRYVGATASGAPASGTFAIGDFIIDRSGSMWVCTVAGTPGTWTQGGGGGAAPDYIEIRDQKANGTEGGASVANTWSPRDINTEVLDAGGHCSIASNQITLDAGTYECEIISPFLAVNTLSMRIQNVTDAATVLLGGSGFGGNGAQYVFSGKFTIAASKALEIQYICQTAVATYGLGASTQVRAANYTDVEIYTVARFWKVG